MASAAVLSFDDLIPASGPYGSLPADPTVIRQLNTSPRGGPATDDPWAKFVPASSAGQTAAAPVADPWAKFVPTSPPAPAATLSFDDLIPQGAAPGPSDSAPGWLRGSENIARLVANGATFGGADYLASKVFGVPVDQERAATTAAEQRTGTVGKIASVAGSTLPALAGGELLAAGAPALGAVPIAGRIAANPFAQSAALGAGMGATDAAVKGDNIGSGAAVGATLGVGGQALGQAVGGAARGIGRLFADDPQVPTPEALRTGAQNSYAAADAAGIVYSPQATARLQQAVQQHMADFGYDPALEPGGAAVLRSLDRTSGQNATLAGIDTIRRVAGRMDNPNFPSSGALGRGIKGVVDDFTNNPRPGDVLMGNGQDGVGALTNARQLYQRSSKDQDLADALGSAELRAGATGSGGNINNATRQRLRTALEGRDDWTPDEQAALRTAIMGTPISNGLRQIGKLSPEGNGLMQALNLGAPVVGFDQGGTAGALAGLGVPLTGFVARRMGDAMTARAVENARNLVRVGGNAAALTVPPNAMQRFGAAAPAPIAAMTLGDLYRPQ